MKPWSAWLPIVVSAVLGGGVGSAVTLAMHKPAPSPKRASVTSEARMPLAPAEQGEAPADDVAQRVRSLERRVSLLTAALTKGGTPLPQAAGKPGEPDEGDGAAEDVASPVFEAAVRDIMERMDDERREERQSRRTVFVEQSATEISDHLGEKLGLSADQRQKVADIAKKNLESLGALRDLPQEERPKSPAEWRERRDGQKRVTNEALRQVLTPAQMQSYEGLPEDEQISGRPPWSRNRGGRERSQSAPR